MQTRLYAEIVIDRISSLSYIASMSYWNPETIQKIRQGYYSAVYFNRTKEILFKEKNLKKVTMQIFQKNDEAIFCGVNQVADLLNFATGYFDGKKWISKRQEITVEALSDGDIIQKGESVMHIKGPYLYFAYLESLFLGILARQTKVATNARQIVEAAKGRPVLFFADRFDYFLNQEADGYAAHVGGVMNVCTQAQGSWWKGKPLGTIPHALIAINGGSTITSVTQFHKYFPKSPLVALVDFDNDCVNTSLASARKFGKNLWGVRLDTAENMVDMSLKDLSEKDKEYHGVNPKLVNLVRHALDEEGYKHVKIIVSGGFNKDKIALFQKEKTPADIYAVGSSMFEGRNDFTADIVQVEGENISKLGRKLFPNNRLKIIR